MNILNAIRKARTDGLFLVLTDKGAKGFATPDQCAEYGATLAGREFAVVRFLWNGGESWSREAFVSRRQERDRALRAETLAAQERISQPRDTKPERLPHPLRRDEQDPEAAGGVSSRDESKLCLHRKWMSLSEINSML